MKECKKSLIWRINEVYVDSDKCISPNDFLLENTKKNKLYGKSLMHCDIAELFALCAFNYTHNLFHITK